MDTLYIMGMMDEFEKGREWIEDNLDFNKMVSYLIWSNLQAMKGLCLAFGIWIIYACFGQCAAN